MKGWNTWIDFKLGSTQLDDLQSNDTHQLISGYNYVYETIKSADDRVVEGFCGTFH